MTDESQYGKGFIPRDFQSHPLGQIVGAPRFSMPLIPRSEWQRIIDLKNADESWIFDVLKRRGVKRKQQSSFPWCHAAGAVGGAEAVIVMSGQPKVELSIASVAGPTVNWQKRGAWIFDDLAVLESKGAAETSVFPDLTTDSSLYTPAVQANAAKHRCRAMDLDASIWDELMTCVLSNIVTVIGVPDWSHCTMGPVKANSVDEFLCANNWGDDWNGGQEHAVNGFYPIRRGGLHMPGEAYALLSVT